MFFSKKSDTIKKPIKKTKNINTSQNENIKDTGSSWS